MSGETMTMRRATPRPVRRGFALIAVLWFVAALSVLVAGLLTVSNSEMLEARLRLDSGRAAALGDAAIQIAVLDWASAAQPPDRLLRTRYTFEGVEIDVETAPASGYIDLNSAPENLLQALFLHGAALPPDQARQLAQRVVDWRDNDDSPLANGAEAASYAAAGLGWRPRNDRFLTPEDLMQVLGVDFDLFARIQPFITVWSSGGPGVNPLSAPMPVLTVLCQGQRGEARRIAMARDAGETGIDTSTLEQTFLRTGNVGNVLHVLASIPAEGGRRAVRGRWVSLRADPDGTPWRTIRAEPVRFTQADES
ncbi:MAG: general secretion pathway protein GspK [Azoarcus sp.]|jgi:general secretion pathway protein K|nr:general secretion pathway protein GspK [Azoarcus sp.]